jgi:ribose transport system substrate-binding protein
MEGCRLVREHPDATVNSKGAGPVAQGESRTVARVARTRVAAGAIAAAACLGLAACSSSGSNSPSPGSSGSGASDSAPATGSSSLSALAAKLASFEAAPTTIPLTTPLKSKPPTGKTVVYLQVNGSAQTAVTADAVSAAAAALGWHYKQINFDQTSPGSTVAALDQALQYRPVGVILTGSPVSSFDSVFPAYKAADVSIIENTGTGTPGNPLLLDIGGEDYWTTAAQELADWFAYDSHGAGHVLISRVDELPVLKIDADSFEADVKKTCPGCSVDSVQVSLAQALGDQGNPVVVSALRRDPRDTYLFESQGGLFTGMTSALSSAGLGGKVKIMSVTGSVDDEANIKNGTEAATTGIATSYQGWMDVDALARHLEGMPIPAGDGGSPVPLLTQQANFTPSMSYNEPADYAARMKALWHVG